MFQRRPRRYRRHSNGRNRSSRNDGVQMRLRTHSFSNNQMRNNFRTTTQSAEKLFEKYNTLAKEALSSGDKTLSENYFQHADHFMRIIEDKNKNQNQNQNQTKDQINDKNDKSLAGNNNSSENSTAEKEKNLNKKEEK